MCTALFYVGIAKAKKVRLRLASETLPREGLACEDTINLYRYCRRMEHSQAVAMSVDVGSLKLIVLFFSLFHLGVKNVFPLMDDIYDNINIQHSCHR